MGELVFEAKVDWWFSAAFYGGGALMLLLPLWLRRRVGLKRIGFLFVLGAVFLFIAVTVNQRVYVLDDDGWLRSRGWPWGGALVRIGDIHRVQPSRDARSSEAPSLDRLRIDYEAGGESRVVFIAPVDKRAFLEALAERSAGLKPDGEGLVRPGER